MRKKNPLKWLIGGGSIAVLAVAIVAVFFMFYLGEKMPNQNADTLSSTTPAETASTPCQGHHDRPIAHKRLSDQKTTPFVMLGRPVQPDRHDYTDYMASIATFPDVRSCLINSEKQNDVPDLTLFDWHRIKDRYDAEVCLFRVFSSIGTVEKSRQWLTGQGFTVNRTTAESEGVMEYYGKKMPGTRFDASWDVKQCGAGFGSSVIDNRVRVLTTNAVSVNVWFADDGDVVFVGVTYTVL